MDSRSASSRIYSVCLSYGKQSSTGGGRFWQLDANTCRVSSPSKLYPSRTWRSKLSSAVSSLRNLLLTPSKLMFVKMVSPAKKRRLRDSSWCVEAEFPGLVFSVGDMHPRRCWGGKAISHADLGLSAIERPDLLPLQSQPTQHLQETVI